VVQHIRKELTEIEAQPTDLSEWIDVAILALDGAWRAGHSPEDIIAALVAKQAKNEARVWPDWRERSEDVAIEHDRTSEAPAEAFTAADVLDSIELAKTEDGGGYEDSGELIRMLTDYARLVRERHTGKG
jgi:hypothetical protein